MTSLIVSEPSTPKPSRKRVSDRFKKPNLSPEVIHTSTTTSQRAELCNHDTTIAALEKVTDALFKLDITLKKFEPLLGLPTSTNRTARPATSLLDLNKRQVNNFKAPTQCEQEFARPVFQPFTQHFTPFTFRPYFDQRNSRYHRRFGHHQNRFSQNQIRNNSTFSRNVTFQNQHFTPIGPNRRSRSRRIPTPRPPTPPRQWSRQKALRINTVTRSPSPNFHLPLLAVAMISGLASGQDQLCFESKGCYLVHQELTLKQLDIGLESIVFHRHNIAKTATRNEARFLGEMVLFLQSGAIINQQFVLVASETECPAGILLGTNFVRAIHAFGHSFIDEYILHLRGNRMPFENCENRSSEHNRLRNQSFEEVHKRSPEYSRKNHLSEQFQPQNSIEAVADSEFFHPPISESHKCPEHIEDRQTDPNWRSKWKRRQNPRLFY